MFSIACLATTKGVVGPKAEDRFAAASVDRHFRRRKPHSMHAAGPVKAIPCRDDAHACLDNYVDCDFQGAANPQKLGGVAASPRTPTVWHNEFPAATFRPA